MANHSTALKNYLNNNYRESFKDADNNTVYYHTFNSEYFVKCVKNGDSEAFYILEKSGCGENDNGRLNYYLPTKAFTAEEIEAIIGTSTYNEYGIVE